MIRMLINDQEVEVAEGSTVLEAARDMGLEIPTLCYHAALRPSGSCRLCVVEIGRAERKPVLMLSCILKVKEGLQVSTQSEAVARARKRAFERLLRMAPQARRIRDLAERHGVDLGPPPDGCIRCRLCVRVCKEIVGAGALRMAKREGREVVIPVEGHCIGCGTCANICPTQAISVQDREGLRTVSIREERIGVHILERCEACGALFATERFLQHLSARTADHAHVKEPHRYCPTCAKLLSDRVRSMGRV